MGHAGAQQWHRIPGQRRPDPPILVLLTGDVDIGTVDSVRGQLARALAARHGGQVVVDLGSVTFMDCSGMRPLLELRSEIGDALVLRDVPHQVQRVIDLSGAGTILFPDVAVKATV